MAASQARQTPNMVAKQVDMQRCRPARWKLAPIPLLDVAIIEVAYWRICRLADVLFAEQRPNN